MYHSVHGEKLNLQRWAIRPIFSDPVTIVDAQVLAILLEVILVNNELISAD